MLISPRKQFYRRLFYLICCACITATIAAIVAVAIVLSQFCMCTPEVFSFSLNYTFLPTNQPKLLLQQQQLKQQLHLQVNIDYTETQIFFD